MQCLGRGLQLDYRQGNSIPRPHVQLSRPRRPALRARLAWPMGHHPFHCQQTCLTRQRVIKLFSGMPTPCAVNPGGGNPNGRANQMVGCDGTGRASEHGLGERKGWDATPAMGPQLACLTSPVSNSCQQPIRCRHGLLASTASRHLMSDAVPAGLAQRRASTLQGLLRP